jgi:hypothetical protein
MSDKHLDPAKSIIAKIGIDKVSELTGKHVSRVYRWMYSKERGGTGGFIPNADAPALLAYAKETGLDLKAEDFFAVRETAA